MRAYITLILDDTFNPSDLKAQSLIIRRETNENR